jgi:hypothetical protein
MPPVTGDAATLIATLLAEEEAKRAAFAANIAASEANIDALKRSLALAQARQDRDPQPESPPSPAPVTPRAIPAIDPVAPAPEAKRGRFYGLAKPDALVKHLDDVEVPLTPRELSAALDAAGFPSTHEDPIKSVTWALKKRSEKVGDVLLIGRGKWGLRKWYTEDELELFRRGKGGMGGRDRASHSARTKAGMAALRANGVPLGRTEKMTPEVMDTIEHMLLDQRKVADVAAELEVSKASIYGRFTVGHRNGRQTVERRDTAGSTQLRLVK